MDSKDSDRPSVDKSTLIEEGTEFNGSFTSDCPIVVNGRIKGDVTAPSLIVGASGAVDGHMKLDTLQSTGELAGEFDTEKAQIAGRVRDNTVVRTGFLEVKLAPTNGKMQLVFSEPGSRDVASKRRG